MNLQTMENYQLCRTNVLLGGQVKWDLLLDSINGEVFVSDFHLSPINNRVPYNRHFKESLLNYSHSENLKRFYKDTSSSFYKNFTNPKLLGEWPIICKKGEKIDTHENSFEMGCRRAQYGIYNKQFEFFCPLWLEKINPEDRLKFKIEVRAGNKIIATKYLDLSEKIHYTHNKFINYLKEYCKFVGIEQGNDDLLAIHLNHGSAQISGMNVSNGLMEVKDLPNLVKNLINRERPLMEFDSLIINEFKNNTLIAPQLFNFNLCFDVNDLLPIGMQKSLMGNLFSISVTAIISKIIDGDRADCVLEKRDFFSNFEYIKKRKCGPTVNDLDSEWDFYTELTNPLGLNNKDYLLNGDLNLVNSLNVLNYLKDHKCVDIINENKITQSIIHWSLHDNPEYIFNTYEGFSGYSDSYSYDTNMKVSHSHLYENTPNIQQEKYSPGSNNVSWCNWIRMSKRENIRFFGGSKLSWISYATDFNKKWVNNIKYNNYKPINLNVLLVKIENEFPSEFPDDIYPESNWFGNKTPEECEIDKDLWIADVMDGDINNSDENIKNSLFIISNKLDNLTFISVLNSLNKYIKNTANPDNRLVTLRDKMKCADSSNNPPIISLKNSLILNKAKGPSLITNEVEYYKNDNNPTYVLRYSGKIKPTFLPCGNVDEFMKFGKFNFLYYKDYVSDERKTGFSNYQSSKYSLYSNSGLTPRFPSIGYYSINKTPMIITDEYNFYKTPPKVFTTEHEMTDKDTVNLINDYEYPWYNNGMSLFLYTKLETVIDINDMNKDLLISNIKLFIKNLYKIKDDHLIDYIYNLYDTNNQLEYGQVEDGKIKNYIYNIKLTLK